jgi:hypothetical protein
MPKNNTPFRINSVWRGKIHHSELFTIDSIGLPGLPHAIIGHRDNNPKKYVYSTKDFTPWMERIRDEE